LEAVFGGKDAKKNRRWKTVFAEVICQAVSVSGGVFDLKYGKSTRRAIPEIIITIARI